MTPTVGDGVFYSLETRGNRRGVAVPQESSPIKARQRHKLRGATNSGLGQGNSMRRKLIVDLLRTVSLREDR